MGITAAKTVSCKLTTPELQKRKATVIAQLKALVLERKELANGFSYKFESSDPNLDKLNEFVKTERTGPNGAKEFLKNEIDF